MQKRYVIGSAVALGALISATTAHAEEPFTANKFQLGGGLNYGLYMGDDEGDPPNPYGLGLGVDLGYTLGPGVYLGGEFNYFFGSSEEEGGFEVSTNIMQYGVEVGYDIGVSPELVIRPKAGIGMGSAKVEVNSDFGDNSESESGLFIPVGAALLYSMGDWFIGGDVRYAIFSVSQETTDAATGASVEEDWNANGLMFGIGAGAAF